MGTIVLLLILLGAVAVSVYHFVNLKKKSSVSINLPSNITNDGGSTIPCKKFKLIPVTLQNYITYQDCSGEFKGESISAEKTICAKEIKGSTNITIEDQGIC
jgi:type IV secretory pathway ATPase VirB11/archaellum biosynthesis ATPase